jgi:hypothetical protein
MIARVKHDKSGRSSESRRNLLDPLVAQLDGLEVAASEEAKPTISNGGGIMHSCNRISRFARLLLRVSPS